MNLIESLPTTSLHFPNLQMLNLARNKISERFPLHPIPFALTNLDVSSNKITEIMSENLNHGIVYLNLNGNDIKSLDIGLGFIDSLVGLDVDGNMFRVPGRSVLEKGTSFLKGWLKDRKK